MVAFGVAEAPDSDDPNRGRIEALYVDPEWSHNGKHVGARLLKAVLDQLDYAEVVLYCAKKNEDCGFWKASGFRVVGEGPPFSVPDYGDVETEQYVLDREIKP